jgi:hypothetical protein
MAISGRGAGDKPKLRHAAITSIGKPSERLSVSLIAIEVTVYAALRSEPMSLEIPLGGVDAMGCCDTVVDITSGQFTQKQAGAEFVRDALILGCGGTGGDRNLLASNCSRESFWIRLRRVAANSAP